MEIKRIVVGALQTNCYIVWTDNKDAFIIDPGDDAQDIKDFINEKKLNVHFIINTHSHFDHIKANYELGFPVYIHKLDAPAIENPKNNYSYYIFGEFDACKPQKLLEDGQRIKLGSLEIEVIHTPGHTVGGICLKVDKVLFTGDTLFKDGIGRTDLPDGSHEDIMFSIKNKLFCLDDDTKVYPGHGESSTISREKNNF